MNANQLLAPLSRRRALGLLAAAATVSFPEPAAAICASIAEAGRWRNSNSSGDPAYIDVKMTSCGDQVLNGHQTSTRYTLKAWVRQSSGQYYGRPAVTATYRSWDGKRWLYGKVPTGGYVDHVWMRVVQNDGQPQLHVLIKHQSLDSKPSSTSQFYYTRTRS